MRSSGIRNRKWSVSLLGQSVIASGDSPYSPPQSSELALSMPQRPTIFQIVVTPSARILESGDTGQVPRPAKNR